MFLSGNRNTATVQSAPAAGSCFGSEGVEGLIRTGEAINLMLQFGMFVVALVALVVSLLQVGKKS
jgi:hypothetical protein